MRRVAIVSGVQPQYTNWAEYAVATSDPRLPTADNVMQLALQNGQRQQYLQAAVPPLAGLTEREASVGANYVMWAVMGAAGGWAIGELSGKKNGPVNGTFLGLGAVFLTALILEWRSRFAQQAT